jgi:hypothetical protein
MHETTHACVAVALVYCMHACVKHLIIKLVEYAVYS